MTQPAFPLMLALDWPAVFTGLIVVAFLFVCVVLILTVLIQRPQGGGLSGAFGSSAGSSQSAFGAKTGDVLTLFTIGIFVVYLFVAVGLNWRVAPPSPTTPTAIGLDDQGAPASPGGANPADGSQTGKDANPPANQIEPFNIPPDASAPAQDAKPQTEGQSPAKPAAEPPASTEKKPPVEPDQTEPPAPAGEKKPTTEEGGAEKPPLDAESQASDG